MNNTSNALKIIRQSPLAQAKLSMLTTLRAEPATVLPECIRALVWQVAELSANQPHHNCLHRQIPKAAKETEFPTSRTITMIDLKPGKPN